MDLPVLNAENFGRSATAGALAYVTAPVLTGIPATTQMTMGGLPLVGRLVPSLSFRTGCAVTAFLTTFIVDAIQERMNHPKSGRSGHYPSLVVHVVAGGLSFAVLPMLAASGSLSGLGENVANPTFGRLMMAGAFNEMLSQYIYENVFDPDTAGSYRYV
eukprot:g13185.t1